jgi:hypothetical protein
LVSVTRPVTDSPPTTGFGISVTEAMALPVVLGAGANRGRRPAPLNDPQPVELS